MANTNYTKSYSILGVFQDDDWETIRAAYKRQIKRWHPDRFQDPEHWKIAEEKSKEINRAYQELADYYQEFGVLPPEQAPDHSPAPAPQHEWADMEQPAGPRHDDYSGDHRDSFEEPDRPSGRRGVLAVVVAGIVLGASYLLSEPLFVANPGSVEEDASGYPGPATHPDDSSAANHAGYDKTGDPGILSPSPTSNSTPDAPEGSWTDKGNASADEPVSTADQVRKDKPHSSGGYEVAFGAAPAPATAPARLGIIIRGSSKDEVLAVQGPPLRKTDTAWDYGLSRIYFQNGKVTDWYENPMNPLKVAR
jgi:hypothetical protein